MITRENKMLQKKFKDWMLHGKIETACNIIKQTFSNHSVTGGSDVNIEGKYTLEDVTEHIVGKNIYKH